MHWPICVYVGLLSHSHGSDCGYSSSMEGSETGSREGSDVACTEGMCNHDETGTGFFVPFFDEIKQFIELESSVVPFDQI